MKFPTALIFVAATIAGVAADSQIYYVKGYGRPFYIPFCSMLTSGFLFSEEVSHTAAPVTTKAAPETPGAELR